MTNDRNTPDSRTIEAIPIVAPDTNTGIERMKDKLLYLALIISLMAMPLVLTSCGDDLDEPSGDGDVSLLMGDTWQFEKATINVLGQKIEMSYDDVLKYMKEQAGTDKVVILDEKIRFTENEMFFVNTGDRVAYHYYSNGKFWCEGMDDIVGMVISMSIPRLTNNELVFRYKLSFSGLSISSDFYYKR